MAHGGFATDGTQQVERPSWGPVLRMLLGRELIAEWCSVEFENLRCSVSREGFRRRSPLLI